MNDLDALGKALREELGSPPLDWQERQRRRLRAERLGPAPRQRFGWAMAVAVACAVLGIGYFAVTGLDGSLATDAASTQWLEAGASALPYRTPDGSSIELDEGSRGRFTSDEDGSQFDLHRGRAKFEVTKRPRQSWTVVAGRYSVHVVGTRFTVSYVGGKFGVGVDEGRVAVTVPQRSDPIFLEAGDRLAAEGDQLVVKERGDAADQGGATNATDDATADRASAKSEGQPALVGSAELAPATPPLAAPREGEGDWHALYANGQYAEALREAKHVGFERLTRTLDASRLVDLADAARLGGDSEAALKALRALESRFAAVATARDSDFLIARLHAQRGETSAAIRRLTTYLERGEGARYALEALGRLMELHSRSGDPEKARALARRYLERAPNGPYHRLAESILQRR
jgi:hypothetical protein